MPYLTPSSTSSTTSTTTVPPTGRPTHRRSYTHDRGPGAFASLGALPRRSSAQFHFQNDNSSSNSSCDSDEDDNDPTSPPIRFRLQLNTTSPIPFPRSSPSPSPLPSPSLRNHPLPPRPSPIRTSSSPILLSNGKPLKSSLKSSSSSPSIVSLHRPPPLHLRARSAPSTPALDLLSPTGSDYSVSSLSTPKNVHFPDQHLETVRVFNRSAKPASLLAVEDTETDTEVSGFPFPSVPAQVPTYAIQTDPIPSPSLSPDVILESISIDKLTLKGSILVRNISYEKQVHVRFTLDDWQTTSEVIAHYSASLPSLPLSRPPLTVGDLAAGVVPEPWDRFSYLIRLEDYGTSLSSRTLYIVTRYTTPSGEWWDNNSGRNYCVQFIKKTVAPPPTTTSTVPFPTSTPAIPFPSLTPASSPMTPPKVPDGVHVRTSSGEALEKRLRGFKLANYAKPSPPLALVTPPLKNTQQEPPESPTTPLLSNSSSDDEDDEDEAPSPLIERPRRETPASLPPFAKSVSMLGAHLPLRSMRSPSPSPPSSSDDLYKAFVQKWCFVGGVGA